MPKLGFDRIADQMVALIEELYAEHSKSRTEQREGALTIGLYGPWGAGKSTLINALDQAFPDDRYVKIPLNPWKWDGRKTLHGFVQESIIDHVSRVLLKGRISARVLGFYIRFQPHLWKMVLFVLFAMTVVLLLYKLVFLPGEDEWITKIGAAAKDPKAIAGTIWPLGIALVLWLAKFFGASVVGIVSQDLRRILSRGSPKSVTAADLDATYQAVSNLSAASGKRFVLFIDDLDRCTPGRVAAFVESIHSLASAGCIVFVACDEEYIASALQAKYHHVAHHHEHGEDFGRKFLEKIVQIPFRVPTIRESDLYSLGLVARDSMEDPATEGGSEFLNTRTEPPGLLSDGADDDSVFTGGPEPEEIGDDLNLNHARVTIIVGQILSEFVEPLGLNIRQVKSLNNTLKLYLAIAGFTQERDARRLAAFVFADRLDPVWLDGALYGINMTAGIIGRLPNLADRLRVFLDTNGHDLLPLYQMIGRRPHSEIALKAISDNN